MNRKTAIILAALSLSLTAGCQKETAPLPPSSSDMSSESIQDGNPVKHTVVVSNLNDKAARALAAELLTNAGIDQERQNILFDHVDQFNDAVSSESLTNGFEELDMTTPKYDPYELQDQWMAVHPDFLGYNCRITAFSLFEQFITIPESEQPIGTSLMMDVDALAMDPSAFPGNIDRFTTFYSEVPTTLTNDVNIQAATMLDAWNERGIQFSENEKASLISVVFHNDIDDPSTLSVGHTGILLSGEENELYFLEKLSFQEPYQLVKVKNREELNNYLMTKYDISFNQPTASPFILENNALMSDYHTIPSQNI